MAEIFSNRELAIIIWSVIFLIFICRAKSVRQSIRNVLKAFFVKKILITIALITIHIAFCCFILSKFNLWNIELLKDTLLYVITASIYVYKVVDFNIGKASKGFRKIIKENVSIIVIITFIMNFFSLPFWLELIFIPTITLSHIIMIYIDNRKQEGDEMVKKMLGNLIFYVNYCLFLYFLFMTLNNYKELINMYTLKRMLMPTLLTAMYLPILYLIAIYSVYENSFVILKCMARDDIREYKSRRKILFRICKLNYSKLVYVRCNWRPALCNTDEEFFEEIKAISNKKRISYYGE